MTVIQEWLRKWYFIPLLVFISALAYLPHIHEFGYFRDDWYLMYSANALGVKTFQSIFAIDRPARGLALAFFYSLFGLTPLCYNISAYVFRVLGALAFLWTLRMIWPRQQSATLIAALFYLIFPGFLSSPNAIDFQPHQLGLFFANFSIALSIKALDESQYLYKFLMWMLSGLMAIAYLSLVEHFIGLEAFRMLAIFLVTGRSSVGTISQRFNRGLFDWLFFSAGPVVFLVWRFLFFDTARKATDFGAQISYFLGAPLLVGIEWITTLLRDIFEVVVLSWGVPLANLWYTPLRLRELAFAMGIVVLSMLATAITLKAYGTKSTDETGTAAWRKEAFWVGVICVISGFLPVILSNRDANLGSLSRYMLASSTGAVILLSVFLDQFRSKIVFTGMVCILVACSVLTHYFNGVQWANSSKAMQNFWWQVSWRIPQLKPGTTLVVNYSHTPVEEDYFIWGPANFLYYHQSVDSDKIRPAIWGAVLNRDSVTSILTKAKPEAINRRSILTYMDYGNILILTQPTSSSCVQVIDGRYPVVSEYEQYDIQIVAGESDQNHILLNEQSSAPPGIIFGSEPEHGWCYYYENASLAYQRGDLQAVLDFGNKARKVGVSAEDAVEWMPFLQAAVLMGDRDAVLNLAPKVKKSPFLALQACKTLKELSNLDPETNNFVEKVFCNLGE